MANKITYADKVGINPKKTAINQVQDIDMNEIKAKHNIDTDRIDALAVSGATTYQTLAVLQAVFPVPSEGTPAKVANDPTASNNGYYSVVSGAWVKDSPITTFDGNVTINGVSEIDDVALNISTYNDNNAVDSNHLSHNYYVAKLSSEDAIVGLFSKAEGGHGSGIDLADMTTGTLNNKWWIGRESSIAAFSPIGTPTANKLMFTFGTLPQYETNPAVFEMEPNGKIITKLDGLPAFSAYYNGFECYVAYGLDTRIALIASSIGTWGAGISLKDVTTGVLNSNWGIIRKTSTNDNSLHFTHGTDPDESLNPSYFEIGTDGTLQVKKIETRGGTTGSPLVINTFGTTDADRGISFEFGDAEYCKIIGGADGSSGGMDFWTGTANAAAFRMRLSNTGSLGIGTKTPSEKLQVDGNVLADQFKLTALNTAPSSAIDTGTTGEIRYDANYMYVCTATNTWKRSALTTW